MMVQERSLYVPLKSGGRNVYQKELELLTMARAKSLSREALNHFFGIVHDVYSRFNLHSSPASLYNLDETGLTTDEQAKQCFYKRRASFPPILNPSGGKAMYTVLVCGNVCGDLLPPFVVYKGKYLHDS
jgi:hypothetical protein